MMYFSYFRFHSLSENFPIPKKLCFIHPNFWPFLSRLLKISNFPNIFAKFLHFPLIRKTIIPLLSYILPFLFNLRVSLLVDVFFFTFVLAIMHICIRQYTYCTPWRDQGKPLGTDCSARRFMAPYQYCIVHVLYLRLFSNMGDKTHPKFLLSLTGRLKGWGRGRWWYWMVYSAAHTRFSEHG